MTPPRITRAGTLRLDAFAADVFNEQGGLVASIIDCTPEATEAFALRGQRVRVTIEPADVEPRPAGVALAAELLGQLKRVLEEDAARPVDRDDPLAELEAHEIVRRRIASLANSAHLALLNAQRGGT